MACSQQLRRLASMVVAAVLVAALAAPVTRAQDAPPATAQDAAAQITDTATVDSAPEDPSFELRHTRGGPASDLRPRSIRAQVAKDKAAARQALADPQRAATDYFARLDADAAGLLASGEKLPYHLSVLQPGALQAQGADAGPTAAISARRQIYLDNLERVGDLNAKSGPMLAYGITPFMHLTEEELSARYLKGKKLPVPGGGGAHDRVGAPAETAAPPAKTGCRKWDGGCIDYTYYCAKATEWKSSKAFNNSLVANVDWRQSSVITPVRDQGGCGSCVVFSNYAALEAAYVIKNKKTVNASTVDLSEQDTMQCLPGDACEGAMGYEYVDWAICRNVTNEKSAKYTAVDTDKCPAKVTRFSAGVTGYTFVDPTMNALRKALVHNPVSVGIAAGFSFFMYTSGVLPCDKTAEGLNHETTVVAYTQSGSSKFWTIKNSWGSGWGAKGYFSLRADCALPGSLSMYTDAYFALPLRG